MKVDEKKFVELSYTLTVDGEVADQAGADSPLGFVFGMGYLLPEFEKNLEGKSKGDKFEFTLDPENGYGSSRPEMIIDVATDAFVVNGQIEEGLLVVGNEIPMMTAEGMRLLGRVTEVGDSTVKMDFNHPMAGKTLNFSGEVLSVRESTPEDYPHAHGGSCGCGCDDGGCEDCGGDCN